jgi:isopentenyldiphosphate isomerase
MARIEQDGIAQDPTELFDVVRADGTPTGEVKPRAEVHRDGDWHRSVHVWVAGNSSDDPFLLVQRRSLKKDTWPGRLDATVGGHYRHGEGLDDALREVEEEIGVSVDQNDLVWLGVRLCASEAEAGIKDREIQDLFLLHDDRPLTGYAPHPDELDSLISLPIDGILAFCSGEADEIRATAIRPGEREPFPVAIRGEDFIPTIDRYYYRVAIAVKRAFAGEKHVVV